MNNEDLDDLNREILTHAGVELGEMTLPVFNVAVARLRMKGSEIREFVRGAHENPIDVYRLNQSYLEFARLTSRDVLAGDLEGLIVLAADMDQIRALSSLSNRMIRDIARSYAGLIYDVPKAVIKAQQMHPKARQFFAMSLVSNG